MNDKIESLNLLVLSPSPTNPRKKFDPEKLQELSASMQAHGVINPLVVRLLAPGKYEVVAGERRFRAANIAGFKFMPCVVRNMTDQQVLECQLIENLQRDDLDPVEEARGFRALLDLKGENGAAIYTAEDLGAKVGKTKVFIYHRLKLLNLPDTAIKALEEKKIPTTTAEMIGRIPDKKLRERAAKEVITPKNYDRPLTQTETKNLIERTYMRTLEGCDFDPEDITLHTEGVKCSVCPHRAGNCPDVEGVRGDTCLNPVCFERKSRVNFERWKLAKESEGKKVLSPDENKKLVHGDHIVSWSSNMVVLDQPPQSHLLNSTSGGISTPWRVLIEGRGVDVFVARLGDGSALECADRDAATAAAKLNGHNIFKLTNKEDREAFAAEQKRQQAEQKLRAEKFLGVLEALPGTVIKGDVLLAQRYLLQQAVAACGHEEALLRVRGVASEKALRAKIAEATQEELTGLSLQVALCFATDAKFTISKDGSRLIKSMDLDLKKFPLKPAADTGIDPKLFAAAQEIYKKRRGEFSVTGVAVSLKISHEAATRIHDAVIDADYAAQEENPKPAAKSAPLDSVRTRSDKPLAGLGKRIMEVLDAEFPSPVKIKDLVEKLSVPGTHVAVWFSTAGKGYAKKVEPGLYQALPAKKGRAK